MILIQFSKFSLVLLAMSYILLGCTRQMSVEDKSVTAAPLNAPDLSISNNIIDCNTTGPQGQVTPALNAPSYLVGQTVLWKIQLSGCPSYRMTALSGSNMAPQDYSASNQTLYFLTQYQLALNNFKAAFKLEGLDSEGEVTHVTFLLADTAIHIQTDMQQVDTSVPQDFSCVITPNQPNISVPINGNNQLMGPAPTMLFTVSSGSVDSYLRKVEGFPLVSPPYIRLNPSSSSLASSSHQTMGTLTTAGYISVFAEVAAASNPEVKRGCYTTVFVQPVSVEQPVVPPPAPTCTVSIDKQRLFTNEPFTATLHVTGFADSATLDGQTVNPNNAMTTLSRSQPGTNAISASVTGPGGTSQCSLNYTVLQKACADKEDNKMILFGTSQRLLGNFAAGQDPLNVADGICQAAATNAGLHLSENQSWKAILYANGTLPSQRLTTMNYSKVYNTQCQYINEANTLFADNNISNPILYNEHGQCVTNCDDDLDVWTGLENINEGDSNCNNWQTTSGSGQTGSSVEDDEWIEDGSRSCSNALALWCINQPEN